MSVFDFQSVSERRHDFVQDGIDAKTVMDTIEWRKSMFTSVESNIFDNNNSEMKLKTKFKIALIDPELQSLSQKVMNRVWDNKEDEFWDNY